MTDKIEKHTRKSIVELYKTNMDVIRIAEMFGLSIEAVEDVLEGNKVVFAKPTEYERLVHKLKQLIGKPVTFEMKNSDIIHGFLSDVVETGKHHALLKQVCVNIGGDENSFQNYSVNIPDVKTVDVEENLLCISEKKCKYKREHFKSLVGTRVCVITTDGTRLTGKVETVGLKLLHLSEIKCNGERHGEQSILLSDIEYCDDVEKDLPFEFCDFKVDEVSTRILEKLKNAIGRIADVETRVLKLSGTIDEVTDQYLRMINVKVTRDDKPRIFSTYKIKLSSIIDAVIPYDVDLKVLKWLYAGMNKRVNIITHNARVSGILTHVGDDTIRLEKGGVLYRNEHEVETFDWKTMKIEDVRRVESIQMNSIPENYRCKTEITPVCAEQPDELQALEVMVTTLQQFDAETQHRMLDYLKDRFC